MTLKQYYGIEGSGKEFRKREVDLISESLMLHWRMLSDYKRGLPSKNEYQKIKELLKLHFEINQP